MILVSVFQCVMAVTPTSITLLYMKRSLSMSSIPVKRMTICASNTTIAMESSVYMTMKILLTAVVALTPSTALLRFVMMRALAVLGVDIGRW